MNRTIAAAWLGFAALLATAAVATDAASPLVRMLAIVAATFLGMKAVVLAVARCDGVCVPRAHLGWFLVWFGMNPRAFARRWRGRSALARRWARLGLATVLAGAVVVAVAPRLGGSTAVVVFLAGLSVVVHFGLLTLVAALVRSRGFAVPLLFDAPWRARTLAEFWTRRWNHGFAEMTAIVVQRPLARTIGAERARFVSFVWSGLLHELALSWPVRAGFGGPTAYFVLQALLVRWQGTRPSRGFVVAALVLPVPLLFHRPFLAGVLPTTLG
ncbi:MAG: hypothetical protein JNK15_25430 [Planctomycetes bacterium]|nr:hypothetical protein [Planctomycetota bacterium]